MTYEEAMHELNNAAYVATRLAASHDGAPVNALREIAAEIDHLIDHNCTRAEMAQAEKERDAGVARVIAALKSLPDHTQ